MPCPHFSREDNDCRLLQRSLEEEMDRDGEVPDEPVVVSLCLAEDAKYRSCAIYRRQVAEFIP